MLSAAAGATALANLPSKWTTPVLSAGVLPAHAQSSCIGPALTATVTTLQNGGITFGDPPPDATFGTPGTEGYFMSWDCGDRCIFLLVSSPGETTLVVDGTHIAPGGGTAPFQLKEDAPGGDAANVWAYLNAGTGDFNSGFWRASDGGAPHIFVSGCPDYTIGAT